MDRRRQVQVSQGWITGLIQLPVFKAKAGQKAARPHVQRTQSSSHALQGQKDKMNSLMSSIQSACQAKLLRFLVA